MKILCASAAALGVFAAGTPALAQQPLPLGATVTGVLDERDAKTTEGAAYDLYAVTLAAGQAVELRMTGENLDAFLELGADVDGGFEMYASDDDSAGQGGARLRYTAKAPGTYLVRARGFAAETLGAYEISAKERVVIPAPAPRSLGATQAERGELVAGGPRLDENDRLYDLYRITGSAGERVMLTMSSTAFDSYVEIGREGEGGFEALAMDDDSAGDRNARILFRLPEAGEYIVRAQALTDAESGPYELALQTLPPPAAAPRPTAMRAGEIRSGALEMTDPAVNDFSYYDVFMLRGRAGETRTISLRSQAFDALLEVGGMTPVGFASALQDDDSGGGTDAQVKVTFERAGVVLIRARALNDGALGSYSLSIE